MVTATIWQNGGDGSFPCPDGVPIDGENLRRALAVPTVACVEIGQDTSFPHFDMGLVVRLSSVTAFEDGDLGSVFVDSLIARNWLLPERRDHAVLAMHEALANAVIHGNLGIEGGNATTIDDFREQGLLISRRIGDPAFSQLAVTLMAVADHHGVEISIQDCGNGFSKDLNDDDVGVAQISPLAKKGRGMGLMRSSSDGVRYEDNGRRVVLFYAKETP